MLHLETSFVGDVQVNDAPAVESERAKESIMNVAAASACVGVNLNHGGPFGACVVRDGKFVSTAHNTVLGDSDPTCHAEMNAIRYACTAMRTHDLSDCELYTTCEPCPMCWGAIQWARFKKIYIGVDRFTAAKFGFDDKVFYDEIEAHNSHYSRTTLRMKTKEEGDRNMLEIVSSTNEAVTGITKDLLKDLTVNRTFRRRMGNKEVGFVSDGKHFNTMKKQAKDLDDETTKNMIKHLSYLAKVVRKAVQHGANKEREVFAAMIVKDNEVISVSVNEVLKRQDATSTAEILCIRKAASKLGTYNLSGCEMYCTLEPDVMSLGGVLWARIDTLYYGLSQNDAARFGFEEGLLQYRELFADDKKIADSGVFVVEKNVGFEESEKVFKEWKEINNVIY